jgi:hypothetical protein
MKLAKLIRELQPQLSEKKIALICKIFHNLSGYGADSAIPDRIVKTMRQAKRELNSVLEGK